MRPVPGTTDTLQASDNNGIVGYTSGSAVTVTIPPGLPKSAVITLLQLGVGVVTCVAATGVTVHSLVGSLASTGQYSSLLITASGQDTYVVNVEQAVPSTAGQWTAGAVSAVDPNNLTINTGTLGIKSGPLIAAARGATTSFRISANTVASPAAGAASLLQLVGPDGAIPLFNFDAFGTGVDPVFRQTTARGTAAAPTAVQTNDFLGEWDVRGMLNNGAYSRGSGLNLQAIENFTSTASGTKMQFTIIGQGSTVNASPLTISGTNTGKQVQVTGGLSIDQAGTFVANGATAVTVAATGVTAASSIIISRRTAGGTPGAQPTVGTITAGVNFTTSAVAGDTSTFNYSIIN